MASLPSYHEATARPDWLHLVAPFVVPSDYPALCLVGRHFWHVFAPRLWLNVFMSARQAGLQSGDDLAWWFKFVLNGLEHTEPKTRALVRVLDAREFAKDSYHFSFGQQERSLNQSFKRAMMLMPSLTCILLDGQGDLDPGSFLISAGSEPADERLLLLSIANCPYPLPSSFFDFPRLSGLVYLDISGIPGSIWPMIQPSRLPDLRILKACNREIDDVVLNSLAIGFGTRLWSLDVSRNRLTDAVIDTLVSKCCRQSNLHSEAYFRVEGKLDPVQGGTVEHGNFVFIEESELSGSFSHPERYLVDAPMYMAEQELGPQEYHVFRSDGEARIKPDSVDAVCKAFSGQHRHLSVDNYRDCLGLTHLKLSSNQISSFGIEKLLRASKGHLEELACDSMPAIVPPKTAVRIWPRSAMLYGILNAAYFRPVFSSNLRVLRLHHSLVTQIPTLEMKDLSTMSRLYVAETSILSRTQKAYPQFFVPDMNPRLTSLTLTHIPRRSSGPLINKLVDFLKLLSIQESAIYDTNMASSSWRGSGLLEGLRHLRLEFEPDPKEEGFSTADDLDAEELMNSGEQGFSFFDDEKTRRHSTSKSRSSDLQADVNSGGATSQENDESDQVVGDFLTHYGEWNGKAFSVPVWIGPKVRSSNHVINDYRRLVLKHNLRDGIGPVTASQVIAGAPDRSFIFHTAWCMAIMPEKIEAPPWTALADMKDVLQELRQFRLSGRARYSGIEKQTPMGKKRGPNASKQAFTVLEVTRTAGLGLVEDDSRTYCV
ncbi:hypothetical protein AK830_g868 [Neonectria ditissima]|uniref:Uncharacterized protein n=1 Tax=Neonectria ditissima TaxID=78410 RepID=A0A0P7BNX4_9HYPO|nr:hypothetical protein AK830_g868 [Neonectria ditissima]